MSKRSMTLKAELYCGIDVSAKSLAVAILRQDQPAEERSFQNNLIGHRYEGTRLFPHVSLTR
jgi:hypothetical protein